MICRKNTGGIYATGDPISWDQLEFAGLTRHKARSVDTSGRPLAHPLRLRRIHGSETTRLLEMHADSIGQPIEIIVQHLRGRNDPTGSGVKYIGTLERVIPAEWDSNSDEVAVDAVEVAVDRLVAL